MSSRIRIYDRPTGRILADVVASAGRAWKLNDAGKCEFEVGLSSLAAKPEICRFRNFVYVTHEYLPAWGGYLWTPRKFDDVAGTVNLMAVGAERLLGLRRSEGAIKFSGTAGDVFVELIKLANKREDLRIRVGEIYSGGKSLVYKLGETSSIYEDVKKLAALSGNEWAIEPTVEVNGNLAFLANWYERRGNLQSTILEQGVNFEAAANVLTEQGNLVNDVRVSGNGGVDATARAETWITQYGLIEGTESWSAEKTADTLAQFAENTVAREAPGRATYRIRAMNKNGLWHTLRLGNSHMAKYPRLGRSAEVRILGMQYPDDVETVDLTVDEVME